MVTHVHSPYAEQLSPLLAIDCAAGASGLQSNVTIGVIDGLDALLPSRSRNPPTFPALPQSSGGGVCRKVIETAVRALGAVGLDDGFDLRRRRPMQDHAVTAEIELVVDCRHALLG